MGPRAARGAEDVFKDCLGQEQFVARVHFARHPAFQLYRLRGGINVPQGTQDPQAVLGLREEGQGLVG